MARTASPKSQAIQKLIAEEIMAGNVVNAADIAATYGMSVRSIQYKIAAIRKVLPADMFPKAMASESQINLSVGIGMEVSRKKMRTSPEELRQDLESLTVAQMQGIINFAREMKASKSKLKASFGHFVLRRKFLRHFDLSDFFM